MRAYWVVCISFFLGMVLEAQVINPGFETGELSPSGSNYRMEGWEFAFNPNGGEAIPSIDTVVRHDGKRSFKAVVTKTGSPSNPWNIKLDMAPGSFHSFSKDDYVEFSFYARANSSGKQIEVKFRDSNNGNWVQSPKMLTTTFKKYTISQKIPQTRTDYKLTFFLAADTGTFWIDDVSVSARSGLVDLTPAVYHVSPDGDDGNSGSLSAPFRTLEKASSVINGNDSLYLHEGRYPGVLDLDYIKGKESHPIVIISWPGERAIIEGTLDISDGWIPEGSGIYSRVMEQDIWGVYYRDSMMMAARWPNASIYDFNFFNQKETYRDMSTQSSLGLVYDSRPINNELSAYYDIPLDGSFGYIRSGHNDQGLGETGVSMEGAVAIMNSGSWLTWASEITSHDAGSNSFEYDSMFSASGSTRNSALKWTRPRVEQSNANTTTVVDDLQERISKNHCHYYVEGLPCLDVPGEWWYVPETRKLWFYPPDGADPNGNTVKVKVRDYSLKGDLAEHVIVKDIGFYGTAFYFESGSAITIENCDFLFPAHSRRVLGDHDLPRIPAFNNKYEKEATGHRLINCSFEYFDGNGVEFRGGGYNVIDNVLLHDYNFSCIGEGKGLITSDYDTVRRVTIYNSGGSEGIGVKEGAVAEYNHLHHFGSLQHDGAGIQTFFKKAPVIYRYNWSHTTLKGGLRFDDGGGLPQPPPYSGQMSHNVSWTSRGFQIKGDSSLINNNLLFNTNNGLELMVHERMNGINTHSITINNLSDWILNNGWQRNTAPGYKGSNVVAKRDSIKQWLRDPDNWDFRPLHDDYIYERGEQVAWCAEGSNKAGFCYPYERPIPKNDSLPDMGPYESGSENYWIPGFRYPHASTPIPKDKGFTMAEFVDLMWLTGYSSLSSDLYFGTSKTEVSLAGKGSESFRGNQLNNIYYPGPLQSGQTYYWRVDAVLAGKTIKGQVWSFTAGQNSNPTVFKVEYQLYGNRSGLVYPLEGAVVRLGARSTVTNGSGEALLKNVKAGVYSREHLGKGYLSKAEFLEVRGDTVIIDTLQFTSFMVDVLVQDKDSGEPVAGCKVELGEVTLISDSDGMVQFSDVEYDLYDLHANADAYKPGELTGVEIYSDTSLTFLIARNYLQLSVRVVDRVTGDPVKRAQISYKGLLTLTNTSGETNLDQVLPGYWNYSIVHDDYFEEVDSIFISGDTSLVITLTRTLARLQFDIHGAMGPLSGVRVKLNELIVATNSMGEAIFISLPARREHLYMIEEEGYGPVNESFWLESDTIITILLEEATSLVPGAVSGVGVYPNPSDEELYVKIPYDKAWLTLISMEGRVVISKQAFSGVQILDLTRVPEGIYYMGLRNASSNFRKKVVIIH